MKIKMIMALVFTISFLFLSGLMAGDKLVLPRLELGEQEFTPDYSKPGGIVIGPAMPRAFHYGGRHAVRDLDGYLHVTWEDPTYSFNYYARSLDTLGTEWTEPIDPHATYGVIVDTATGEIQYEIDRALMAKMAVDPRTGFLYMMPFHRWNSGERYRTGITRSTDGGTTWTQYLDLGTEINRPDEEVSWGTMAIGYDPNDNNKTILHIVYTKNNVDAMYTRADLTVIDDPSDPMSDLVFTRSDGVTVGDEAISYVPSGVVFQGTVVLDRNNDPHIIFSGDGGADTFGDKTPYHIYYKSAASAWGPIPPQQLMAELEDSLGMPEMVFDKNNRGYYFLDKNYPYGAATFGTWEPPTNPTSATDFGTLNNTGEVYGFEAALDLIESNFPGVEVVDDDDLYLPNADVDDDNDIVYLIANTNSYSNGNGGDIVILALNDATSYAGKSPAEMEWTLYRWVTDDGVGLGDVGPDVIYDPSSSTLDVFWSGSGATDNEAQYLPAHVPPAAIDAKAKSIAISIPGDKIFVNEGDEIGIVGVVKNNGTNSLPPVSVLATVTDSNGVDLFSGSFVAPPLAPGGETPEIEFGTWIVVGDRQSFSLKLAVSVVDDEAPYNDDVATSFFVYPDTSNAFGWDSFQDTAYTNFPTYLADGSQFISGDWFPEDAETGGWTVEDNSHGFFADPRDYYISTWMLLDEDGDGYAQIRHMQGVRNDTAFGDISVPPGYTDETYAQPQDEMLLSPFADISGLTDGLFIEWDDNIDGTDGDDNFPIYAWVDLSTDGGATWEEVYHRDDETGPGSIAGPSQFLSFEVTSLVSGEDEVQFRFWWRNENNDGAYATWNIDNVYLMERPTRIIIGCDHYGIGVPKSYALHQNYPNPFNPRTMIQFDIPEAGDVRIDVYNLLGQKVMTLINGYMTVGSHKIGFDASNLSSGVYYYTLKTSDRTITKKMLLLK